MKRPLTLVLALLVAGVLGAGVWFAFGRAPTQRSENLPEHAPRAMSNEATPAVAEQDAPEPKSELSGAPSRELTNSGEPARAPSAPPAPESPRAIQARALRAALEQFKNGPSESDRRGETNDVLTYAIAAILDDAGRSKPRASALGPRAGEQLFVLNQREYRFQTGEFPEYDEFLIYARGIAQQVKAQSRTPKKEPPKFAPLDIELVKKIEARAQSALKLLDK